MQSPGSEGGRVTVRTHLRRWTALSTASVLLVGAAVLGGCADDADTDSPLADRPATGAPTPFELTFPGVAEADRVGILEGLPDTVERVEPSVVTILTRPGVGSGVVYNDDGVIVTNAHVVGEKARVEVALADGTRLPAEVLATDEITDLAVLQVEREGLRPADFRRDLPRPGELVLAMGSPLGFANSVTIGVVSGLSREIPGSAAVTRSLVDLIQTDAAISPGNSGGALIDADGAVIGINEAYIPPVAGAVSLGFAIPAGTVVDVVEQLLADGVATHPYLGLQLGRLTPEMVEALDLSTDRGVAVLEVVPNGPAADAGIRGGDVIVSFAGADIDSYEGLLGELRRTEPGQRVDVVVNRGGERLTLPLTIRQRPTS